MEDLRFLNDISWREVFSAWRDQESMLPKWIEHYTQRGFHSWDSWRNSSVEVLHPENLSWKLYEITDPVKTVPNFYIGPFRSWIKKYSIAKPTTFHELVEHQQFQEEKKTGPFPEATMLVGLQNEGRIIIIEGVHRCCALAVAQKQNISIKLKVFLACADFKDELPQLGQEGSPT